MKTYRAFAAEFVTVAILALTGWSANAASCEAAKPVPPEVYASRVIAMGEVHGTQEAPGMAARLVCSLATADETPVVLALELPDDLQEGIDAYVNGGSETDFENQLAQSNFWNRSMHDGRSSTAMRQLISAMRSLRVQRMRVSVLAFDVGKGSSGQGGRRDAMMAKNIRTAWQSDPKARIVILTGNIHASKTMRWFMNRNYESALYLLADLKPLSFLMRGAGGEAWNCGNSGCGPHSGPGDPTAIPNGGGHTLDARRLPDFDGYFDVGTTTASPPVVLPTDTIRR